MGSPARGSSHGCRGDPRLVVLVAWLIVSMPRGRSTPVSLKFKFVVGKLHSDIAAEMLVSSAPRSKSALRNHEGRFRIPAKAIQGRSNLCRQDVAPAVGLTQLQEELPRLAPPAAAD